MSTTTLSSLAFASQQVVIYIGIFLFIAGIIGGPLVLLVFLSLNTFRQSSCAFYLTVMSFVNTVHLFTGLLTFIMIYGFGINWIDISLSFCKFRQFYLQSSIQISFACMCLATIDQFLATCSNPRWHRWNNIKLARYIVIGIVIFWFLFEIPLILNFNHAVSSITGASVCTITNTAFRQYFIFFHVLVLNSLPAIILTLFGILAYRNVQTIAYRAIPLVRRELDKQLTTMVLVHVFYDVVVITPQIIVYIFNSIVGTPGNLNSAMQQTSIQNFTAILFYCHFAGSFYIYVCVSKRFRQQLIYVLSTIHLNRWRRRRSMIDNQIELTNII